MLPLVDAVLLQNNPKFNIIYTHLTTQILNPDGSTKNHPQQKERDAVSEALRKERVFSAKAQLLEDGVRDMDVSSFPPSSTAKEKQSKLLPQDLTELLILLSSCLSHSLPLPPQTQKLLESTQQWSSLQTHLPTISVLLSTHLQSQALALARIVSPTTNPSYLHRSIPKLVPNIQELKSSIDELKSSLAKRRTDLVSKVQTVLGLYHMASTLVVLHLEQSTHGLVSRHIKSKAEYLSLLGQQLAAEAKEKLARGERLVYSEEVKQALANYLHNLRVARHRLEEKRDDAQRVLRGYGVGRDGPSIVSDKEKVMRSIAEKYTELEREKREVGRDVARLKGR